MTRNIEGGKVFSFENDTEKMVATIQSDGITRHYECTLGACDNPLCMCGTVHVSFSPRENQDRTPPISPYLVDIDVRRKQLAYVDEKQVSKENLAFAEHLLSILDNADFQLLWKFYFSYKNEKTKQAPLDVIEADFDYKEVEENGLMYFHKDVLPYGDPLLVTFKNEDFMMMDQYCLKPKCPCTDATLSFVANVGDSDVIDNELFTVAVNYKKKQWSPVEGQAVPVDIEAARSAVENQIPDFYKLLLKRHIELKTIYAHCKKRQFKQPLHLPKVGRNDPCPCGSGKKYKKCCMK